VRHLFPYTRVTSHKHSFDKQVTGFARPLHSRGIKPFKHTENSPHEHAAVLSSQQSTNKSPGSEPDSRRTSMRVVGRWNGNARRSTQAWQLQTKQLRRNQNNETKCKTTVKHGAEPRHQRNFLLWPWPRLQASLLWRARNLRWRSPMIQILFGDRRKPFRVRHRTDWPRRWSTCPVYGRLWA
jgi:hypothetical protein